MLQCQNAVEHAHVANDVNGGQYMGYMNIDALIYVSTKVTNTVTTLI